MKKTSMNKTVIMATGGTGGHVFPAVSVAEKIIESQCGIDVVFATDNRGLKYLGEFKDNAIVQNMKSKIGVLGFYWLVCLNTLKAIVYLHSNRNVAGVVGFGGYPSVPFTLASSLCRRKTIIHEQNAIIGRANKMLLNFRVDKMLMAFEEDVGTPTRFDDMYEEFKYSPSPESSEFKILALGGSQGSKIVTYNVSKAIVSLPSNIREKIHIYHQVRRDELPSIQKAYESASVSATVQDFFNEDEMRDIYTNVDITISRSGASTMFEIIGFGIPAVLVPFAQSVNGDQKANAERLSSIGGAIVLDEASISPEILASNIKSLFAHRNQLEEMSKAIKKININANSATRIANEIINIVK
ncbi:MAG: UDP-N-acetylglucosamine--N-acetylmuramyl-(pentapeptide) pyrophosphoryl-undecaprenol N-acetylglucosamine transferase [Holosporales bacterium]|jgi:UDP-N-acetylglucosamine--N-acetylmuramyl-(pentapeptide) pyrophosphoryl-undecaprenol N-acetylglucosamine transferase|nr:UDP-N-acetylglucosamine--N-acetylmuramyl-(pentapeptide) pyrophosphoryl-undecaprenol N-acetylglucosamine transferase [Holosporales bacterium]